MTLDELRGNVRSMLSVFDDKTERLREKLLASARIIHKAEAALGERHPTPIAMWAKWVPLRYQYNAMVDSDRTDKEKAASDAGRKGSPIREIHQTITGLSGLNPLSATWGPDPRSATTGVLAGPEIALAIAITIVVGVLGVAALTVWLTKILERIKKADSLDAKGTDLLDFFSKAQAEGWTREGAASALKSVYGETMQPGLINLPPWALPAAIGVGVLALVFFVKRPARRRAA